MRLKHFFSRKESLNRERRRITPCASVVLMLALLIPVIEAPAQYYFGRNKVHYVNFRWQILKTRHFDIYFYPEMRELAETGATFAEEAYSRLENQFNQNINNRIPLIFYSNPFHFQQTNTIPYLIPEGVGGFFEFLKGRVVIPSDGSLSEFRHVINHELVHVFMHTKVNRILKDHKRTQYAGPPLWFTEGLAEYWSEGWDSEAEMFIRDAVLSGYLVPLNNMYQIYGTFLMYKEGQAICKFIAETYGEEKILQLLENVWKSDNFSEVMELTLGLDYRKFDEQWLYHLKKKKYPLMEDSDAPGMITHHVTNKGINTKPAFAEIGGRRYVVFVSNRMGYSNIYRIPYGDERGEKNHLETLIEGERTSEFEAFNLLRSKIDVDRQGRLAFVSKSEGKDALYIYSLIEKRVLHRHQFADLEALYSPSWAPAGDKIVFSGINFGGARDLYIFDLATASLQKLTNDFYDDRDPSWSPDGKVVAFSSDRTEFGRDGAYNLFLYHLETGAIDYVTCGPQHDYTPVWSPDGSALAFTSDRDGVFNIWLLQNRQAVMPVAGNVDAANSGAHMSPLAQGHFASVATLRAISAPPHSFLSAPRYPQAINGAGDLRKLTSFTTGAFDPEWTDNGSLVFTAFENFGFQIRELKNVKDFFDQSKLSAIDTVQLKTNVWAVPKLDGEMAPSTVSYKRRFSLDIAQSQITQDPIFGSAGGAQLAISDMLGNEQYYFLIFNNAQSKDEFFSSFNLAVTQVDLGHRANRALGLYHFAGHYYNYAEGFFYERRYGGFGAISYPLNVFQRLEASLNIRKSDKEWEYLRSRRALLVSNFVSYVKDNSLWGPSGPLDGERFNFTLGNTIDVQHANVNFYTLIADYRRYFRTSLRTAHAFRLTMRYNNGKEAFPFFMGGSWDLRLYPRWQIWGQKTFLLSNEFRFPAIDKFMIAFPFGGLGFTAIRGALFTDVGNAWDKHLDELLGSAGFGVRVRVGGFLVLRYDIGKRFTWSGLDEALTFKGLKLHPKVHQQFFFGWDF
ncbi:MAG: hypothetical protein ONB44_20390 [candidate division KSB1 bacterium]|nr:hypothetical protein [candidate division KSB1 bacterium]MDZ7304490.1 hypothetical protein [candidate division KSB1 bacterium]MDZ7312997.1 hypothetical protein [candidate division KSB1 bacterium]